MKKSLVTIAVGGTLLLGSAVPAHATRADHCLHLPITVQEVVSCACVTAVTILRDLTGDPWTCAN